ncbi:hypothetical protein D5086_001002 [Populus alba]|uniref:Uncharacterized protein n=1 Tax=Populus alba TaxID=43335 RepID=A0ACC4CXI5_POPAL
MQNWIRKKSLVYSYGKSVSGFAAEELEKLSGDFYSNKWQTWSTPRRKCCNWSSDTAILSEAESFNNEGRSAPSAEWKGRSPATSILLIAFPTASPVTLADILATFDDAIADGVNIISESLGSDWPLPYMEDPITIGSFHAMKNGILTSNSAGNSVPYPYSLSNHAPWTLTKTVICDALVTGSGVVIANGVGAIMADSFYSKDFDFSFPLLETVIRDEDKSQKS